MEGAGESDLRLKLARLLTCLAGALLLAAAFFIEFVITDAVLPKAALFILIVLGGGFLATSILLPKTRWSQAAGKLALASISIVIAIGGAEAVFRLASYDFHRQDEFPTFFRPPTFDMGGGILRRTGPAVSRGRVLTEFMRVRWGETNVYANEAPVEIHYDRFGFRNPESLDDWEIVVAGDSFVEQ